MGIKLKQSELEFSAVRASGPGGQHVNKVSTAVQLRFDSQRSSLPMYVKAKLLELADRRISKVGIITVKAQRFRSQDKNKQDALERLQSLIDKASAISKNRVKTKPSRSAKEKRLKNKKRLSDKKFSRSSMSYD